MLTGGEPLAHPEIASLLPALSAHLPVSLMTNGLALRRHALLVRAHVREVYVSWDAATDETYHRIRGVRGLSAVREGVEALRGHPVHARVTVWAENVAELPAIRQAAERAGCTAMSLLPADVESAGFGDRGAARGSPPRPESTAALADFLASTRGDPFVVMSDAARERVLRLSRGESAVPRCVAPWTSGAVDPTGRWRHCFFLPSPADTSAGLRAALRRARPDRRTIDVATNPTCLRCVCWRG